MSVRLSGGDVDVSAGTGVQGAEMMPLVRLTVASDDGDKVGIWMKVTEARAVGLDLIAASQASLGDTAIRRIAKDQGLDGDSLIGAMRAMTVEVLGPGD